MSQNGRHKVTKIEALMRSNDPSELDNFEKDAIAGFSNLPLKEALDLKDELDTEFREKVPIKNSDSKNWIYLLAAASVIGIIGFGIYFLVPKERNNHQLSVKQVPTKEQIPVDEPELFTQDSNAQSEPLPVKDTQRKVGQNKLEKPLSLDTVNLKTIPILHARSSMEEIPLAKQSGVASDASNQSVKAIEDSEAKIPNTPMANSSEKTSTTYQTESLSESEAVALGTKNKKSPEPTQAKLSTPIENIIYKEGFAQLKKDLKGLLALNNCDKAFEAILIFDNDLKIEKIVWLKDNSISKSEKKIILSQLRSLTNFEVKNKAILSTNNSFTLSYQP